MELGLPLPTLAFNQSDIGHKKEKTAYETNFSYSYEVTCSEKDLLALLWCERKNIIIPHLKLIYDYDIPNRSPSFDIINQVKVIDI
jgi:hypothetical protein